MLWSSPIHASVHLSLERPCQALCGTSEASKLIGSRTDLFGPTRALMLAHAADHASLNVRVTFDALRVSVPKLPVSRYEEPQKVIVSIEP